MEWNDTRAEELGAFIDQGLSAAQVAAKLGVSRDAVIGAAHRKGWRFGRPRPPVALGAQQVAQTDEPFPTEALACISTPSELAASLLDQYRVTQAALPLMLARVMADESMREQVFSRLLEAECRRILDVEMAQRHQAEKRRTGGGPLGAVRASNTQAHAAAVADALMDTIKLPNGKKLGDATRRDLASAMHVYQIQVEDASIKYRWMRLLQQCVPEGKLVREVLTDERVAELRAEARRSDA